MALLQGAVRRVCSLETSLTSSRITLKQNTRRHAHSSLSADVKGMDCTSLESSFFRGTSARRVHNASSCFRSSLSSRRCNVDVLQCKCPDTSCIGSSRASPTPAPYDS
ncbi:hypothetical protein DOTSEDRAFT_73425 [Dothistroma septosporum NZE10]|uniref:Uncharacterized protein n=1 Tax=Dothistroma septosporum (strain NZE10 / CBS 128990) TaxID=675120 RepID=N1PJ15_DOTSN|nr:hypothetical protein DOTSEDRAFT_73425 [Dothistroma septosporum NZE10]